MPADHGAVSCTQVRGLASDVAHAMTRDTLMSLKQGHARNGRDIRKRRTRIFGMQSE
jgi:hypothetical protein